MYMYDGKMGIHVPANFDLSGNTKLFSAWKLWWNQNPGYSCTTAGRETITAPIYIFMKFTVDSIREKLWKKFNTGWREVLTTMKSAPVNEGVGDFGSNEGVRSLKQISNHIFTLNLRIL